MSNNCVLYGKCDICGKEAPLSRKYYYYNLPCEYCGYNSSKCTPENDCIYEAFKSIDYCKDCVPKPPVHKVEISLIPQDDAECNLKMLKERILSIRKACLMTTCNKCKFFVEGGCIMDDYPRYWKIGKLDKITDIKEGKNFMEIHITKSDFNVLIINAFRYSMPRFMTTAFYPTETAIRENIDLIPSWILLQFVEDTREAFRIHKIRKEAGKIIFESDTPYVRREFLKFVLEELNRRGVKKYEEYYKKHYMNKKSVEE